MAKRLKVAVTVEDDILVRLRDLPRQATAERSQSHYYVGRCVSDAINEITALRKRLGDSEVDNRQNPADGVRPL